MDGLKIIGDIFSIKTTIIGSVANDSNLIKQIESNGFYNLNLNNISLNTALEVNIKEHLNIDNYFGNSKEQNDIVADIINLVNLGHKKLLLVDVLSFVDDSLKKHLINYLKKNNVVFINITSNMEESLCGDYLVVIYNNKVALEGKNLDVFNEEKLLSRMGFKLPFIIELSIQLKYYGLIDKIYLAKEDLVSALWK